MLSDNPIAGPEADRYGFGTHAKILCDAISAADDLPLTIGVFGPWGMGKSSFMKVCEGLLKAHDVRTVWFNPWKYDQKDEIWHALIQTVLAEIAHDLEKRRQSGEETLRDRLTPALDTVRKLSRAAAWLLARRAAGPLTAGLLAPEDIDAVQTALTAPGMDTYLHVNRFEQDFRDVVDTYTDGGQLVLFIDDLDRCTPEAAITVLDSLKLFLGDGSCVFVLAMDYQIVAEAAAKRFDNEHTDGVRGRQYLEKLIHFPFHLPGVPFEALHRNLHDRVTALALTGSRELWELIEVAFAANPRRVRRFVNGLNHAALTLHQHSDAPGHERLLHAGTLLAFQIKHPDFFTALQNDPGVWARFDEAEFAKSELGGGDAELARNNPGARRLIAAVSSRRTGADFPPPPTPAVIRLLTEVLTVSGGAAPDEVMTRGE
ncbi:KAP family P-loop NTPase fold protein [Streptomyces alboniger]|uniref:KAP NTPase domain-containing protein n=1 Tax=Streptomyces alboniger TaxID=132473 RepID=A0A5J6HCE8_STRAD|nr:P-loop NTPase fold protein [Streptomyces alboniger]QEV16143.1 hypothetical protein CP975_00115 [Streptomyces alboniger]